MVENADNFRMQRITEIEQFLKNELNTREGLYKKYKKGLNSLQVAGGVCTTVGLGATALSLGLLATGIGVPIAVGIQGAGIGVGLLGAVGRIAEKKISAKLQKHDEIKALAQSKLSTIYVKAARAYEDGCITDEEFKSITNEQKQYIDMKKEIQTKTKKVVSAELTEAEKNKLVQDTLQSVLKNGKLQ